MKQLTQRRARRTESRSAGGQEERAGGVLKLQRDIGNRAVGALLARAPDAQPTPADAGGSATVTLPGIGQIPLLSAGRSSSSGGGGSARDKEPRPESIDLVSEHGTHSAALQRALHDGKNFPVATLSFKGGVKVQVESAYISSFQFRDGQPPTESWTLNGFVQPGG